MTQFTVGGKQEKKSDREKFIDELQERIQDKNHHEMAEGITWAIETLITKTLLEKSASDKDKK